MQLIIQNERHSSFVFLLILCINPIMASIHTQMKHFEILKPDHMKVRTKRSAVSGKVTTKTLTFSAFGKRFNLLLTPGSLVFDPKHTEVVVHDGNGRVSERLHVDNDDILSGHIVGSPGVTSVGVYHLKGSWAGHIHDLNDSYSIEPLSRHDRSAHDSHMVMYRDRDFVMNNSSSDGECGTPSPSRRMPSPSRRTRRLRRQVWKKTKRPGLHKPGPGEAPPPKKEMTTSHKFFDVCDILSLMDYYTVLNYENNNTRRAAMDIIYWISRANTVFVSSEFIGKKANYIGLGNRIRKIIIMQEYSADLKWNQEIEGKIEVDTMTDNMRGYQKEWAQYCLVHKHTWQPITEEVLGAAMNRNNGEQYGMCGSEENIGWSTFRLHDEIIRPSRYITTMTHEIGHNWGAEHDPKPGEENYMLCSPTDSAGGWFLMYYISNEGTMHNSHRFSECSRKNIGEELDKLGQPGCFLMQALVHVCGDGVVSGGEECDELGEWQDTKSDTKRCCTPDTCRLMPNATCSPSSSPCCTHQCVAAPNTQECVPTDREQRPCENIPKCNGRDFDKCPPGSHTDDGSYCSYGAGTPSGHCLSGKCWDVCSRIGDMSDRQLSTCQCHSDKTSMCRYCCKDAKTKLCEVTDEIMPDTAPCAIGTCHHGVCYSSFYLARGLYRPAVRNKSEFLLWICMLTVLVFVIIKEVYRIYTMFTIAMRLIYWIKEVRQLK